MYWWLGPKCNGRQTELVTVWCADVSSMLLHLGPTHIERNVDEFKVDLFLIMTSEVPIKRGLGDVGGGEGGIKHEEGRRVHKFHGCQMS